MRKLLDWPSAATRPHTTSAGTKARRPAHQWRLSTSDLEELTAQIWSGEVDVADAGMLEELGRLARTAELLTAAADKVLAVADECHLFASGIRALVADSQDWLWTNFARLALLTDRPVPQVRSQLVALEARGIVSLSHHYHSGTIRLSPSVIDSVTEFHLETDARLLNRFIATLAAGDRRRAESPRGRHSAAACQPAAAR